MRLDVVSPLPQNPLTEAFIDALRQAVRGRIRLSRHERLLYATDASIYQVEPLGIVEPVDEADVMAAVKVCLDHRVAVLPRGGGTSLAGQCTNAAMVIDVSPCMRRVIDVDVAGRTARVEPGLSVDQLNRHLLAMNCGLFFAPDPATAAQASIGGCIGNNAAGTRSIKYGRTSENIAGLRCVLMSGEIVNLGPEAGQTDARAASLATEVSAIVRVNRDDIRSRFPKTVRRNAGYGLDLILKQIDANRSDAALDLTGLICGSEGTLALVTEATVKLHSLPHCRGLALATFASIDESVAIVPSINATGATAVELLDDVVLTAARTNPQCREYLRLIPSLMDGREPVAVLMVEYEAAESPAELPKAFARLRQTLGQTVNVAEYLDPSDLADLWALRKAAEPLLHAIGGGADGHAKPHTFVEDNAVPVDRLGEFVAGFKQIVKRHNTEAAYYAHASVGVLHVRPLIDLHTSAGRAAMAAIAVEVADLAKACGGVMSGEHGDGRVRGPLLARFFGPALMNAFAQTKAAFDPLGLLNPGNIVAAGEVRSIAEQLRQDRQKISDTVDQVETFFDYTDQHGFRGAVEMCNGAGVCRKTAGGVMCPSYRATLDERHATRGRGNALRLAITGQLSTGDQPAWDDPATIETLHLCLQCKACKSECPSNVDIARLKAEYTAQRFKQTGTPIAARLMGHVRTLNRRGSIMPRLANGLAQSLPIRAVINRLLKLSPKRSLPPFARRFRSSYRTPASGIGNSRPLVVLYEDCFHGFNEPHIMQAADRVLRTLGYEVALPKVACCGRSMISTGLLGDAAAAATRSLNVLLPFLDDPRVAAFVYLEPSCLSAVKDDWLTLKLDVPIEQRRRLADRSMLVEEFIGDAWDQHPIPPVVKAKLAIAYHGHCHQKAVWGQEKSAASLRRVADVSVMDTTCCGMAGSFGFTADRYDLSMAIGELSVFPQVRGHGDKTIVTAGTSCRHQILDGTARRAIHPVDVFDQALATPTDQTAG